MTLEERLLKEATRIGDELIDLAKEDEFGLHWETISPGIDGKTYFWKKTENIYSGSSGILLFIIQLYRHTGNGKYKRIIQENAQWLINYCEKTPAHSQAFFTGRVGVAFALTKVTEILDDDYYKTQAIELIKEVESFTETSNTDDLLNGVAGVVLGLMHIHSATGEDRLISSIEHLVTYLLRKVHLTDQGAFWDLSEKNIKPLCGYSHGQAGLAAVFFELGYFFQNPAFYYIASQAIAYENDLFDDALGNWPDFRKGIFTAEDLKEHKTAYKNDDKAFFFSPGSMAAWCHGAPGIGLSRLRAFDLLGEYQVDVKRSLIHTTSTAATNPFRVTYSLCHGGGGNAILFLEAYKVLKDESFLNEALKVAESALSTKRESGVYRSGLLMAGDEEDLSLFMGTAGIGYFYLMCLDPFNTPNVLNPVIQAPCVSPKTFLASYGLHQVKLDLVKSAFPETVSMLNTNWEEPFNNWLHDHSEINPLKAAFLAWVRDQGFFRDVRLEAVFGQELIMDQLDNSIGSRAYLNISRIVELEENHKRVDAFMDNPQGFLVCMAPFSRLTDASAEKNGSTSQVPTLLLFATNQEIVKIPLNPVSGLVLESCQSDTDIKAIVNRVAESFELSDAEANDQLLALVVGQLDEMAKKGMVNLRPVLTTAAVSQS